MAALPGPIESLIEQLVRLPGIGRRGAERLVTHLLEAPPEKSESLATALSRLRADIRSCETCGYWCEDSVCPICSDPGRDATMLCVVESSPDLMAFEKSGAFHGRYHVLGGRLSPLGGVSPGDLSIDRLERRIGEEGIQEVIIATSPTIEGDATALYLARRLAARSIEVTRIGVGLPLGASLGYADAGTLRMALEGRRKLATE